LKDFDQITLKREDKSKKKSVKIFDHSTLSRFQNNPLHNGNANLADGGGRYSAAGNGRKIV